MKSWLTLGTLYLLVPNALVHYFCLHCCCDIRLSSPFRNALFIVAAVYASSLLQYSSLLAVTICASHRGCEMCFSFWFRYIALLLIEMVLLHFAALVTSAKTLYNSLSAVRVDCNLYVLNMYLICTMSAVADHQDGRHVKKHFTYRRKSMSTVTFVGAGSFGTALST